MPIGCLQAGEGVPFADDILQFRDIFSSLETTEGTGDYRPLALSQSADTDPCSLMLSRPGWVMVNKKRFGGRFPLGPLIL